MSDFEEFKQYISIADQLFETMTPEQILECLRMLALHLADYRSRFGEIPKQDLLDLAGATEPHRRSRPAAKGQHATASRILSVGARRMGRRGCASTLGVPLRQHPSTGAAPSSLTPRASSLLARPGSSVRSTGRSSRMRRRW